jgi:hypothetical protein
MRLLRKTVSGIMLTLLLIGMLTLAFNIQQPFSGAILPSSKVTGGLHVLEFHMYHVPSETVYVGPELRNLSYHSHIQLSSWGGELYETRLNITEVSDMPSMDWTAAYEVQPSPTSNGSNWFYWNIGTLKETIYFHDMFHVHWEDRERTTLESLGFSVSRNFTPKEIPAEEESINQTLIIEVRPKEKDKILYAGAEYRQDLISATLLECNYKEHVNIPSFFMPYNWTVEWRIEPPLEDVYTFQATFKLTRKQGVTGIIEVIPRFRADLRDQTAVNVPNANSVSTPFEVGNISVVTRDGVDWNIGHEKSRTVLFSSQEQVKTKPSENVTIYDGDLIIDNYKKLVIKNCTWIQRGNIIIRNYGRLRVNSAALKMMMDYWHQYEIFVNDQGLLEIENGEITTDLPNFHISAREYSKVNLTSSWINGLIWCGGSSRIDITYSVVQELRVSETSKVALSGSQVWRIHPMFVDPYSAGQIGPLRPGLHEYWNLHQNGTVTNVQFDLTLRNVTVDNWALYFNYRSGMTVSQSAIEWITLDFNKISAYIENLRPGFYENLNLGSLVFRNSSIGSWTADIFESATVTIEKSTIGLVLHQDGECSASNSQIQPFTYIADFFGKIHFNETVITNWVVIRGSQFSITGNLKLENLKVWVWVSSDVIRNYEVIARDSYGNLLVNADLTLRSKDSTLIWTGTTDAYGKANFTITFNDYNYHDFWTLRATVDRLNSSKQVGFLTDTPIEIGLDNMPPLVEIVEPVDGSTVYGTINIRTRLSDNVQLARIMLHVDGLLLENVSIPWKSYTHTASLNTKKLANGTHTITATAHDTSGNVNSTAIIINVQNLLGDLDGNGIVNIIDVANVARAFGSKPEDKNWNPIADLDGNGEINIIDVAMVAKEFGKTVGG